MTTNDPLAGIPVTTSIKPRAAKARPTATRSLKEQLGITTIAAGRAAIKRRKLTGTEYKGIRDTARQMAGYDDKSPIWGKTTLAVLKEIADAISGPLGGASTHTTDIVQARLLNEELRKRFLSRAEIGEQVQTTLKTK